MILPVAATFVERSTNRHVEGSISATTLRDVRKQQKWPYAAEALDHDWNWLEIWLGGLVEPQNFECYSAAIGGDLHALMALDLRGRKTSEGRALVVDYLATSPRDRVPGQGFKYLGVALVAVSVARSVELGLHGRVWLESLPDSRTLAFYKNLGMTRRRHKSREGYAVFVFESKRAMEFLDTAINEQWVRIAK